MASLSCLPDPGVKICGRIVVLVVAMEFWPSLATSQEPRPPEQGLVADAVTQRAAADKLLIELTRSRSKDQVVQQLIDMLVSRDGKRVQTAVTALTLMESDAVPEIIRRIDDRREMNVPVIIFKNPPSAWEAVSQYSVEKVIDALNLVLEGMSGHSVAHIDLSTGVDTKDPKVIRENEQKRMFIAAGWRRYLAGLSTKPPARSNSGPTPEVPRKSLPSGTDGHKDS